MKFTPALAREYATLWDGMEVTRLKGSIASTADRIIASRTRYEAVQAITNVPWFVVGIIHSLETGLRFDRHLHNGDPLSARTKLVPAGRPLGQAPFSFEQSCQDALCMKGYDKLPDWTIERICWALERYNGWGYRKYHPDTLSPYLWSGSNHYVSGKYVADGKWSKAAVSSQSGALPLLKTIAERCPEIKLVSMFAATSDPSETSPASNSKTEPPPSPAKQTMIAGAGGTAVISGGAILADPAGTMATAVSVKNGAQSLLAGVDLASWGIPALILVAACAAAWLWGRK